MAGYGRVKIIRTNIKIFVERMECMNPVFWLLLFIAAVTAWFAISGLFMPVGKMLLKRWDKLVSGQEEPRENEKNKKMEEKNNE